MGGQINRDTEPERLYSGRKEDEKMKEIIIKKENAEKIEAALKAANSRARNRYTNDYADVAEIIKEIEEQAKERYMLTYAELEGTEAFYTFYSRVFPNAYNGIPESTAIHVVFRGGKWRLVDAYRDNCNQRFGGKIIFTDETKQAVLKKIQFGFKFE